MKRFLQIFFFLNLLIIIIYAYNNYFINEIIPKQDLIEQIPTKLHEQNINKNNIIKNLKYEINLLNNNKYVITSELSELIFIENQEIIIMKKVLATYFDSNNFPITIKSDNATYNTLTNNTFFEDNVSINYKEHNIKSKKLLLDFLNNVLTIYEDVIYKNNNNSIITDNIQINLISKDIRLYMNDPKNKKIEIYNN